MKRWRGPLKRPLNAHFTFTTHNPIIPTQSPGIMQSP